MTHFAFNNFLNVTAKITTNFGGAKLNIKGAMHTGQGDINAGVTGIFLCCKYTYISVYNLGNIFATNYGWTRLLITRIGVTRQG